MYSNKNYLKKKKNFQKKQNLSKNAPSIIKNMNLICIIKNQALNELKQPLLLVCLLEKTDKDDILKFKLNLKMSIKI